MDAKQQTSDQPIINIQQTHWIPLDSSSFFFFQWANNKRLFVHSFVRSSLKTTTTMTYEREREKNCMRLTYTHIFCFTSFFSGRIVVVFFLCACKYFCPSLAGTFRLFRSFVVWVVFAAVQYQHKGTHTHAKCRHSQFGDTNTTFAKHAPLSFSVSHSLGVCMSDDQQVSLTLEELSRFSVSVSMSVCLLRV